MKFKSCNWLLWVIITLALIPSCVSAYFSPNLRQGSEPIFSIFASDADPFEPASTLSFSPLTSEISCQGSDTWRYGRHHAKELTPYLYTGRRYSPVSEQYFNRHRYYSPKVGRFISKDPLSFEPDNNLYRYCQNSPTNFVDPFGLWDQGVLCYLCDTEVGKEAVRAFREATVRRVARINLIKQVRNDTKSPWSSEYTVGAFGMTDGNLVSVVNFSSNKVAAATLVHESMHLRGFGEGVAVQKREDFVAKFPFDAQEKSQYQSGSFRGTNYSPKPDDKLSPQAIANLQSNYAWYEDKPDARYKRNSKGKLVINYTSPCNVDWEWVCPDK